MHTHERLTKVLEDDQHHHGVGVKMGKCEAILRQHSMEEE
jgi:hypothetical protein